MTGNLTPTVRGTCAAQFAPVAEILETNLASGRDVGASVAVFHHGEAVVDIWGGSVEAGGERWERDTLVNVWSTTKTMTALAALVLADRGELDLDASVGHYWPEFKAEGKDAVLVRHVLGHTAGLPYWEPPFAVDDLYDWDFACERLASQRPLWAPGTAGGYHAITQGFLVGEVVRRIVGTSFGSFFASSIAAPLGADFYIGTPAEFDHRIAPVVPVPIPTADKGSMLDVMLSSPPVSAECSTDTRWRRAEIPAGNGHGNARSVATIQHVIASGGIVGDTQLLSPQTIDRIFEMQFDGTDVVLGVPMRHGIGFALDLGTRSCFWGGWGGSVVFNNTDLELTVAYAMNRMAEGVLGDDRGASFVAAALHAAGV